MQALSYSLQVLIGQGRDVHPAVLVDVDVSLALQELAPASAQPREAEHPGLVGQVAPRAGSAVQRLQAATKPGTKRTKKKRSIKNDY